MKTALRLFALSAVFAVAALAPVPQAGACCIPCHSICQNGTPPNTVCCSGISTPGDACGLTTCGKWWKRPIDSRR